MPAIEASGAEIVVVADADVWTDGLSAAVRAVEEGAAWAIPHLFIHRLTEEGTAAVLRGRAWQDQAFEQRPYRGVPGGGIVIARREVLLEVPLDPRFKNWGQEDESWGMALGTLCGLPWRGEAPLLHLWHPPQRRLSRTRGSREGWNLRRRYMRARRDPEEMRQLISEAHDALSLAQSIRDAHPAPAVG